MFVVYFLAWTFTLYWIHRLTHSIPCLMRVHGDHHKYIHKNKVSWHWSNLFLYNDTKLSTLDLWITEVVPTLVFSAITGQWWIAIFYYFWAALLQESIEHAHTFDVPILTSGKWHLMHHKNPHCNFGLFTPIWDVLFNTNVHIRK